MELNKIKKTVESLKNLDDIFETLRKNSESFNDKELMEYVSLYISPIVHLGDTLKNDKEFILKMIIKYPNSFNKIKTEFKNDKEFLKQAILGNNEIILKSNLFSNEVKNNEEFMNELKNLVTDKKIKNRFDTNIHNSKTFERNVMYSYSIQYLLNKDNFNNLVKKYMETYKLDSIEVATKTLLNLVNKRMIDLIFKLVENLSSNEKTILEKMYKNKNIKIEELQKVYETYKQTLDYTILYKDQNRFLEEKQEIKPIYNSEYNRTECSIEERFFLNIPGKPENKEEYDKYLSKFYITIYNNLKEKNLGTKDFF